MKERTDQVLKNLTYCIHSKFSNLFWNSMIENKDLMRYKTLTRSWQKKWVATSYN